MTPGQCPKCRSFGQRFYDRDEKYRHYALRCFVCCHVSRYVSLKGKLLKPAPYAPERDLDPRCEKTWHQDAAVMRYRHARRRRLRF